MTFNRTTATARVFAAVGTALLNAICAEKCTRAPAFFGRVGVNKRDVAYHLRPLYYLRELERTIPERLVARCVTLDGAWLTVVR